MRASRHKETLLNLMREQGEITAGRVFEISNANHYLGELKRSGKVDCRWTTKDGVRFKLWWIKGRKK